MIGSGSRRPIDRAVHEWSLSRVFKVLARVATTAEVLMLIG
ncbi:hypothetical protein [Nocardia carnea]|nr:hypothetical protein [Nocardia carnea]